MEISDVPFLVLLMVPSRIGISDRRLGWIIGYLAICHILISETIYSDDVVHPFNLKIAQFP